MSIDYMLIIIAWAEIRSTLVIISYIKIAGTLTISQLVGDLRSCITMKAW
jgi:hypothetical protein